MNLYDYLMESRTKEELAKELAATVKQNVELKNKNHELSHTAFWLKVELEKEKK